MKKKAIWTFIWAAALMLALAGCGGGGSSDGSATVDTTSSRETGNVALLLIDGPADDYDHIWITIRRVLLLTEDGGPQVVVFEPDSPVEYDLLDLRPESDDDAGELLALEEVPAGRYAKIRLEVERVRGETVADDGSIQETLFRLPSGKIDLNPRGEFRVVPNSTIAITIDIDCDKSIHISEGPQNFRPVVFVDIEGADLFQRCPRFLQGRLTALDYALDGQTVVGFELTLPSGISLDIAINTDTTIFDANGDPLDSQILAVGDALTVRASLEPDGLLAGLIIVGEVERYAGIVESEVDIDNRFELDLYPTATEDIRTVAINPDTTWILWGCDEPVSPAAIQPGMRARVIGPPQDDGTITALVVVLRQGNLTGQLESI